MDLAAVIARYIGTSLESRPRLAVAFDGPDAAGKSTLADRVATLMPSAVRASIDDFHRPIAERRARGDLSPEGYYFDTFALPQVCGTLGDFRAGSSSVVIAAFDRATDRPHVERRTVPVSAALLFDGVFLQRPELRHLWDLTVYLHVSEDVTLRRALARDQALFGTAENIERRYRSKYLPGQALYRNRDDPQARADIVIDNTNPDSPGVLHDRLGIV